MCQGDKPYLSLSSYNKDCDGDSGKGTDEDDMSLTVGNDRITKRATGLVRTTFFKKTNNEKKQKKVRSTLGEQETLLGLSSTRVLVLFDKEANS